MNPELWILCKKTEPTSVSETFFSGEIEVYPNPVVEDLWLVIPRDKAVKDVSVFSAAGRLLFSLADPDIRSVDFSGLPRGIYLVRFDTGLERTEKKVVKW